MLVIRFFRIGKKDQASFKIVVTDKKRASGRGRFVEEVGFYNPLTKEKGLKEDRIKYWISVGAQPSDTVYNLLVSSGIVEGKKRDVHKKAKEKEKPAEGEAPVTAKPEAAGEKLKEDKSSFRPSPPKGGLEKEEVAEKPKEEKTS